MRPNGDPDNEYVPKNADELVVFNHVKAVTGQDIARLWSREEYRDLFTDESDIGIDMGHDYIVWVTSKVKNYYVGGLEYLVDLDGANVALYDNGSWIL